MDNKIDVAYNQIAHVHKNDMAYNLFEEILQGFISHIHRCLHA